MVSATLAISGRRDYLVGLAIALTGAILFSAKAIVAKLIYRYQVDAVTVLAFRMLFSLPFFIVLAWRTSKGAAALPARDILRIMLLGSLGYYLSSFLDFLGLQYISVGLERLILFLTPSFVLLISAVFLKKRVGRLEWMALVLSYAGIALVFMHDVALRISNVYLGGALVLGSAMSYAMYLLLSGEMVRRVGALRLVAYAMCVSSVECIAQFLFLRPVGMLAQPSAVLVLSLGNAVFCTVLPVIMTMVAVARIGAGTASQASMVGPVSTLLLGTVILNEPITAIQIAGTILVMTGIYVLSRKRT